MAVAIKIDGEEENIKCTLNITKEQLDEYLDRLNKHFETSFYELYEKVNDKTNEVHYQIELGKNEKAIRFVALENKNTFPIKKAEVDVKIGVVAYKENRPLALAN